MSNNPILRALLRCTFVEGGVLLIGIDIGIMLEKMTLVEPPIVVDGTRFARVGVLLLALWLPVLWLLNRLERRDEVECGPDQTRR